MAGHRRVPVRNTWTGDTASFRYHGVVQRQTLSTAKGPLGRKGRTRPQRGPVPSRSPSLLADCSPPGPVESPGCGAAAEPLSTPTSPVPITPTSSTRLRPRHETGPGSRSGTVSAGVLSGKPLPRSQGAPRARDQETPWARDQGTPRARHHDNTKNDTRRRHPKAGSEDGIRRRQPGKPTGPGHYNRTCSGSTRPAPISSKRHREPKKPPSRRSEGRADDTAPSAQADLEALRTRCR
jgi:hypothetical protein